MIHLDTNIVSYALKKTSPLIPNRIVHAVATQGVAISSMVYAEILFGIKRGALSARHAADFREMCSYMTIEPWTIECADAYAEIRSALSSIGKPIGTMDLLIASQAFAANATLITNNEREFKRIPGLKVENWTK